MKKVRFILPVMLVVIVFFCMASGASAAPFQNSKDLHKAHENNAAGSPIYNLLAALQCFPPERVCRNWQ